MHITKLLLCLRAGYPSKHESIMLNKADIKGLKRVRAAEKHSMCYIIKESLRLMCLIDH